MTCAFQVSEGDCYYISSGGQGYPVVRGFAFYYSLDEGLYHVLVTSSSKVWELKFTAELKTEFVLVRIAYHPLIGNAC